MTKPLNEQVVVLTGASSGIGRETALRLAKKGARVVVSSRNEEALDDLVDQIKSEGGNAAYIPADVSDYKDVAALAKGAVELHGRIDTWVNIAGVLIVGSFEDTDIDEARRLFNINFWGEYYGVRVAMKYMKEHGGGTIINISSLTARRPFPLMSVYSASKAAINGLTEALQAEFNNSNVKLCMVMPATIDTPLFDHALSKEGLHPNAIPPVYPPSEVAKAIEKCAEHPRRLVYAGPAAQAMAIGNTVAPALSNWLMRRVMPPVTFTEEPEPSKGQDNLNQPMSAETETTTAGWGSGQRKAVSTAASLAAGLGALFLVRRYAQSKH